MKTWIATVSLGGTLEDKLDGVATVGFDGVEILDADLEKSPLPAVEVATRSAELGLSIDLYQPFRRGEGVTGAEFLMSCNAFIASATSWKP
ncbi:hypothetical protein [Rhodococcus artemisiae]|uniref:Xylose isomerase-like TIM barrel protein n=1 Tax=Rhodococcus artemisiae TaxID=714159 RepID=A0ABU7LBY3_9NOCA|nr:hypothetical protein [Rhodococcus artemisiae]MEE2059053.1 hypothetical protein [Rhodococcus artemisiae]